MDFNTFISMAGTILGILGTLFIGAIWVLTITSKISNRAYALERDMADMKLKVKTLEEKTSFQALESVFTKVCLQVFHSKEFKEANREAIRDTLLHIERNKDHAEAGAFEEILSEIRRMHADIIKHRE